MEERVANPPNHRPARARSLVAAVGAFIVANLIHNKLGLDPAVVPAVVLVGLYWWRPRRALLWIAALAIGLPSFAFFKSGSLLEPANVIPFLNHLALLTAGLLAALSVGQDLWPRRPVPQTR